MSVHSQHSLQDLHVWKQQLTSQINQLRAALHETNKVGDEELGDSANRVKDLNRRHEEAYSQHFISEQIVERMQLTTEAIRLLFRDPEDVTSANQREMAERSRRVEELITRQQMILNDLLAVRAVEMDKATISHGLRMKNRELRYQNRRTMVAMRDVKQTAGSTGNKQRIIKAESDLRTLQNRVAVQRNVLQALIVGSGVNWAQTEVLRNLVVDLGRHRDL